MINAPISKILDFYKRVLTDTVFDERLREKFFVIDDQIIESEINSVLKSTPDLPSVIGNFWPPRAHTMIGLKRLDNLQFCIEDVLKNNVSGDFIETGVWRGGASIFMRLLLREYGVKNKIVYVSDSFEGLPKPDPEKYPADKNDTHYQQEPLRVSQEQVEQNFKKYGVLDEQVKFLKGWFKDTMKNTSFEKLSILRLDGDMYSSTWDVLENLYHKVSSGGYVIIDDYALYGCRMAVDDFRLKNKIHEPIFTVDWSGIFWKKGMSPIEINTEKLMKKYACDIFTNIMLVYSERPDLQITFPEAMHDDLHNLFVWAGTYGINEDVRLIVDAPLYVLLLVYCERLDLQDAFPNVQNPITFFNLVNWAKKYGVNEDPRLHIYSDFFSTFGK